MRPGHITELASLGDVGKVPTVAVIINCGTRWATTLALVSARANTEYPVVVINCESRDNSKRHFELFSARYGLEFGWLEWPLRRHGEALDMLFATVTADAVLLLDSDIEIVDRRVTDAMDAACAADPRAYGAGFLHGPTWLGATHGLPEKVGYYAERMWVPLVLLRTIAVRQALDRGVSFAQERVFRRVAGAGPLSRWLAYRFWLPGLNSLRVRRSSAHVEAAGWEPAPAFVEYDTGARVHAALTEQGRTFAAIDVGLWGNVRHFHGVTRAGRTGMLRAMARRVRLLHTDNATGEAAVVAQIKERLAERYGIAADFVS